MTPSNLPEGRLLYSPPLNTDPTPCPSPTMGGEYKKPSLSTPSPWKGAGSGG